MLRDQGVKFEVAILVFVYFIELSEGEVIKRSSDECQYQTPRKGQFIRALPVLKPIEMIEVYLFSIV